MRMSLAPVVLLALLASLLVGRGPLAAHAQICGTGPSCLVVHPTPGCDGAACCTLVCQIDPTCCGTGGWDQACVVLANSSCVGYPGAAASGSCFSPHANPNCDSASCSSAVCAFDPFCCSTSWDASCAALAGFACPGNPGTCGGAGTGSCFQTSPNGACNDVTCCTAVCAIDPTCCSQAWDNICVIIANDVCITGCEPPAEPGSVPETESCNLRENDPCYTTSGGTPETLLPNRQVRGSIGTIQGNQFPRDVDVFTVVVPDSDGDGVARVSLEFASSAKAWAALLPEAACAPLSGALVTAASELCVDNVSPFACVPPGTYRVVVSAGTFPNFGSNSPVCGVGDRYNLKAVVDNGCANACDESANSCFAPAKSPGCSEEACCEAVCAVDPFCCESLWDTDCVILASDSCLTGPPANDACSGAIALTDGGTVVNTLRSTLELPPGLPACGSATFARDVWLRWVSDRSGFVEITTCSSWFDTVLAVYAGTCGSLQPVGCSDNAPICGVNGSRVGFKAACGEVYFIRVGPKSGGGGETLVTVESIAPECPNCPADINGDGQVNGSDLTALLGAWGAAGGSAADLNGDGQVNGSDLTALLGGWGACP